VIERLQVLDDRACPPQAGERGFGMRDTVQPAVALLPIVALAGAVFLLGTWESRKPPEM
jgi:hypothetical protein